MLMLRIYTYTWFQSHAFKSLCRNALTGTRIYMQLQPKQPNNRIDHHAMNKRSIGKKQQSVEMGWSSTRKLEMNRQAKSELWKMKSPASSSWKGMSGDCECFFSNPGIWEVSCFGLHEKVEWRMFFPSPSRFSRIVIDKVGCIMGNEMCTHVVTTWGMLNERVSLMEESYCWWVI